MAKTRSARSGRKGKKKAKKSARRPKPARKVKKSRKPARRAQARRRTRARKKPVRRAPARRAAARKAPARKKAKKAKAKPKAAPAKAAPAKAAPAKAAAPRAAVPAAQKKIPRLDRARRRLADTDEDITPSAPSTLSYQGGASAAKSGRSEMRDSIAKHTETGPELTGGDVDADWEDAYAVGDEAPGGDNPTPDQDRVDDIGKALGVQYADNEELKGADKIIERDRHRWELDPASSDDYVDRKKEED